MSRKHSQYRDEPLGELPDLSPKDTPEPEEEQPVQDFAQVPEPLPSFEDETYAPEESPPEPEPESEVPEEASPLEASPLEASPAPEQAREPRAPASAHGVRGSVPSRSRWLVSLPHQPELVVEAPSREEAIREYNAQTGVVQSDFPHAIGPVEE
jgi:hypothetical protein